MDVHPNLIGIEIALILVLILISGILTTAQKAVSTCNKNNIKTMAEEGNKKAQRVLGLSEKHSKLLSTSIIFVCFSAFYIGQMVVLNHGSHVAEILANLDMMWVQGISIILISCICTAVFVVFAVHFPRQIARQHAEGAALALSGITSGIMVIMTPVTLLVNLLTDTVLFITRQNSRNYDEEYSEENVISMLEIGQKSGALKEEGKKMINSIFAFDDKLAYEIMTPRTDVFSIDIDDEISEYIDDLMEMKYSRIPVYEEDSDNIIGILNIKDYLIEARKEGFEGVDIRKILREGYFAPETKNIDSLFFEFQKTKQHIAILIDEYGGFSGIVTMEDIIEEVMGEIDDEYDEEENIIEEIGYKKYLIDGYMDLDDINERLETNLQSETSETVGGLIIDILGEIPQEDSSEKIVVDYENYQFEVVSVKDRRIERVIMTIGKKTVENEKIGE